MIRLRIPELNEERRKELVEGCPQIRRKQRRLRCAMCGRDGIDVLKKLEKDHEISKDDHERYSTDIQKATDQMIQEVDQVLANKEKEILTV